MKSVETILATDFGSITVRLFRCGTESCLVIESSKSAEIPTVRIHCACLFGEALHSLLCDCRQQLDAAIQLIQSNGGVIVYLEQEGRGLGMADKIRAMEMERLEGVSTVEAFRALGFAPDVRNYELAIAAMKATVMGRKVKVITNNPQKLRAIELGGFEIVERIEPPLKVSAITVAAVRAKQKALGHIECNNFIEE